LSLAFGVAGKLNNQTSTTGHTKALENWNLEFICSLLFEIWDFI